MAHVAPVASRPQQTYRPAKGLANSGYRRGDAVDRVGHVHASPTVKWTPLLRARPQGVIPKMLRPIFLRDRTVLRELSACAWKALQRGLRTAFGRRDVVPGAVMALATAGDLLNGHPHVHAIVSHGAWTGSGQDTVFRPWQLSLTSEHLEQLFRRYVLQLLTRRGRIEEATTLLRAPFKALPRRSPSAPWD